MKRFLSLFLTLCMLVSLFAVFFSVTVSAATSHVKETRDDGLSFESYSAKNKLYGADYYEAVKRLENTPRSFESWIYLFSSERTPGTVIGNSGKGGGSFRFGIVQDRNPDSPYSYYPEILFFNSSAQSAWYRTEKPTHKATFSDAGFKSGEWTHVVVTVDEVLGEFKCYINGELRQTVAAADTCQTSGCDSQCQGIFTRELAAKYPMRLGGTCETMNPLFFRGYLQDVAVYSDVLTPNEVKGCFENGVNSDDPDLICYYDIDSSDTGKNIVDASGNGYDLYYSKLWLSESEMQLVREEKGFGDEYDYSIAVIGDIQYMTKSNPEDLFTMYHWIADNKEAKDIRYSIGLGDITDQCQSYEWDLAYEVYGILEAAGIEYSLVRGNHDVATVSGIEESSKETAVPERYDELFFGNDFYRTQFEEHGGFYEEGSVKNTYRRLSLDGDDWLIVNLDFHADENVRAWANGVIEAHPEHRVIIVTHEYVTSHGKLSTYGNTLWADVASKHANVEMVLGGHVTYDNINLYQTKGEHGNTVTQMLIDAQFMDREMSGLGVVTMFYFREDGTVIDIEHYSTVKNAYLMNINQISVDLRADCDYPEVVWNGTASAMPEGEGTESNPYRISSAANLLWMAEQHFVKNGDELIAPSTLVNPFDNKYFIQTCDINLYGKTLSSIGYSFVTDNVAAVFGGIYDGCGYKIYNGKIENPMNGAVSTGLFGEVSGAVIKNLALESITVSATQNLAFLVGRACAEDTRVEKCTVYDSCRFVFSSVEAGTVNVGAIVGQGANVYIVGCENLADIKSSAIAANAGQIIGSVSGVSTIYDCIAKGEVALLEGSQASIAGIVSGSDTVIAASKGSGSLYNAATGSVVHTASLFTKSDTVSHTSSCACGCGKDITLYHVNNDEGYCKYCQVAITGASISIDSDVSIKYYVSVKDSSLIEGKTLQMQFMMNSVTVTTSEYDTANGELVFTLDGILPHQLGDIIDVKLSVVDASGGITAIASKSGYSVKENCFALLEAYPTDEKIVNLVSDLLTFATEAQRYLESTSEKFILAGNTVAVRKDKPTLADKGEISSSINESCKISSVKAIFDGKTSVVVTFNVQDLALLEIEVNGEMYAKDKLKDLGNGSYSFELSDIYVARMGDTYEISLFYNGEEVTTAEYSVYSYAYELLIKKNKIDAELARDPYRNPSVELDMAEYNLFLALYKYASSAKAFNGEVTQ